MDPFNLKASLRALAASKRQEPAPVPEEPQDPIRKLGTKIQSDIVKETPPGLLERAGGTALSGLAIAGNALDVPGSMARDLLTWLPGGPKPANPFDQLASPFTHENRTTGRELLRGYGLAGKEDTAGNFTTGLAAEIALDPLTYLTFGGSALTKGGRAARALNLEKQAADIATALRGRKVGPREARHIVTPKMILQKMNPRNREILAERMRKDFGLAEKDFDRQLGGLARISLPFTDRPFTWNKKPITFWGLTDEDGVIGAGKVRGRGGDITPSQLKINPDDLPPGVREAADPHPPTDGGGPAPQPVQPVGGQPTPPVAPVVDQVPAVPVVNKAVVRQSPDSPNDMIIDLPGENSVQAIMRYASDADENPHIFLDQFIRQPKAAKGTGRKMLEEIVEATKDRNPASITGAFDDNVTLGAFASKFGSKNLVFRDRATGDIVDIPFSDVKANPSQYTVTHYFKPEFKPQPKPATEVTSVKYSPEEIEAGRQLGYEIDDIPSSYKEMAEQTGSTPIRLLATESAASNLVDMVSKEGTPLLEALDQIENYVDTSFDGLGLGKASPAEVQHARQYLSTIDRPLTINDLIDYGKARVANAGKGKAQAEAERIFKTYGSFDMDEGLYYRAVLGKAPKPKTQKALLDDAGETAQVAPPVPSPAPIVADAAPIRIEGDDAQSILLDMESKLDQSLSPAQVEQAAIGLFDSLTSQAKSLFADADDFAKMAGMARRTARRRAAPIPGFGKARAQDTPEIEAAKAAATEQKRWNTIQQIVKAVENKYGAPSAEVARDLIYAATTKIPNEARAASALQLFGQLPPSELKLDNLLEFVRKQDVLSPEQLKFLDDMIPSQFRAKKGKLKSEVNEASLGGATPTMVNLKTLEGLPEEAKPIVSDMINRIGQRLFDDVKLSVGGDAAKATTAGDIDMATGFINVYNTAIKNKTVDRTTVHEFWHHLSKFLSADEVKAVRNEFEDSVALFRKENGKGELPYELSSIDEYFAHKLTDLSMKYLGRPKPEDLIGRVWAKALETFERVWDAIRQTLGYDETKKIMTSFLDGHRAGAIKMSDSTLVERLADDLEPGNVLKSQIDQTETPEFKNWFGASKVVDEAGKPLELYHGSLVDFKEFRPADTSSYYGRGVYLTASPEDASRYASSDVSVNLDYGPKAERLASELGISYKEAKEAMEGTGGNVYKVYANLQNPLILDAKPVKFDEAAMRLALAESDVAAKDVAKLVKDLNAAKTAKLQHDILTRNRATQSLASYASLKNHDGLIIGGEMAPRSGGSKHVIAFKPEQIKSATANRGTFDPNSRSILESQADPILSSEEIARQLNQTTSSKIAKGMDTIGASILDSALGRQMTALFDQSVLGQLSKEGQTAARMAYNGYREAITKERSYMSRFLRTWYDTEGIREDIIANTELRPLADYEVQFKGDKKAAAEARLKDARVIQNGRVNDLRRILERPLWTPEGEIDPMALVVTPEQLPDWVGKKVVNGQVQVDAAARQTMANMLAEFRKKALKMITREWMYGINTSRIDGYYPRILSELPGAPASPWNPNYGKLLDPTHPHQKPRDSYLIGYTDNSSVINDISVDPEFSGIHAAKKVREELTNAEVNKNAEKLWQKYAPRLSEADAHLSWTELDRASDASRLMKKKVTDLTRKIMTIDPAHAKHQIPLFSNDLFSAMELRLEHHHRSIMHAQAIRNILEKNSVAKNVVDGESVVIANVLKDSKYDSKKAGDVIRHSIPKEQLLEADKNFWNTEIASRAQLMDEINAANATRTGEPLTYKDPGGRPYQHSIDRNGVNTLILPDYIEKASSKNTNRHDLIISWVDGDPSSITARWDEIIPMEKDSTTAFKVIPDPKDSRLTRTYDSPHPNAVIFEQVAVPMEVGKAVTKFVKGPKVLDEVRPVVRAYDKFTNMWKMMQTGMLPFLSFHGRNLGSGQASNFYMGIQKDPRFASLGLDPKTWLNPVKSFTAPIGDAHKISTGQTIPGISQAPMFRGRNLTDEQATEELRKVVFTHGVVGEKQGISAEQLMDTVGTAATQYPGIDAARSINPLAWKWSDPVPESTFAQRWLMPWMSKGVFSDKDIFRPGQLGRDLGSYTENLNRLSPFIAMIRQGYDPRAAAELVNRAQVDYTSMSNFNREYTRRLFPFASYTLGMAPTVTRQLLERPGGGMARTVMATTQAGQTAEQGVTPDYIRETASIPLGMSEDGTRSYITGFGLPFEDTLQFAQLGKGNVSGLLREFGSRMNPIPKALIEIMTGRSLYQAGPFGGREIEDLDPTIGRIIANVNDLVTGEKTERAEPFMGNPWVEYGISNAGPGRMLNTVRTVTDPRKWDVVPWKLLLNLGTGVRVADVSPSAQDAILRERLAKVMKDFGGRMYSRPYFPDYAREDWTPEEAADAAKIDALLKLLGQRAKDRRAE